MKDLASPPLQGRLRPWLTLAAAALVLAALVPPAATYARQYAYVQALQFVIFGVAAPALLVLGAGSTGWSALPGRMATRLLSLAARPRPASDAAAVRFAILRLIVFMAAVVAWRLPAVTVALARDPALAVLEMVTLLAAGLPLWAELTGPKAGEHQAGRPLRATLAALAMWTIWVIAYVTGMSSSTGLGSKPSAVTDQQAGVGIMWAVPAICFVPVICVLAIGWLGERDDPDRELREATGAGSLLPGLASAPRPPRGWRLPRG